MFETITKNIFFTLTFYILTIAQGKCEGTLKFEGLYIGAAIGYLTTNSQVDRKEIEMMERKSNFKMSDQASEFSCLIGYGKYIYRSFYLGIQGQISRTNFKSKYTQDSIDSVTFEHQMQHSLGVSTRFGYNLENFMLVYGKLGVLSATMHFKASEPISPAWDQKERPLGFVLGVGADFEVTPHTILGIEFSHVQYQSLTLEIPTVTRYKIKPQSNTLSLKIAWKF